tara:strand:+ start:7801 stop:8508 length:708 start_codon:yes stop_codon:yes gene_type:complete
MKYLLAIIAVFLTILSCSKNPNEMHLTGEVKGLKKGTLLLQKIEDSVLVSVDSVVINGASNFSFSQEIDSPQLYYLYVRLKDGSLLDDRVAFFAEPGEVNITTSLDNFNLDAIITGSRNENILMEFDKLNKRYSDKNLELIEKGFRAKQDGNDSLILASKKQQENTIASKYLMTVNFALNHKDAEAAPFLMLTEVYDANIKYLDTVYNSLTPKVKDSKYGKILESYIKNRKEEGI